MDHRNQGLRPGAALSKIARDLLPALGVDPADVLYVWFRCGINGKWQVNVCVRTENGQRSVATYLKE